MLDLNNALGRAWNLVMNCHSIWGNVVSTHPFSKPSAHSSFVYPCIQSSTNPSVQPLFHLLVHPSSTSPSVLLSIHPFICLYLFVQSFFGMLGNECLPSWQAVKCVDALLEKVQSLSSRRSSYELSAKCYFYYGRAYELVGRLHEIRR